MGASAIRLCSDLFLSLVSLAICEGWFFFVSLAQSSHKALFPADLRHAQGTGSTMWERVSAHRESGDGRVDAYCGHSTQGRPANQPWHAVWGTGIPWDVAEAKTPLIDLRRGWGGCTTNKLLTSISENATLGFQHHHLLGVFEKHRLSGPTLDLKNQNLRVNWSPRSFLFAWWKSTTRLWYRSSAQLSSVHWLSSVRLFATPWTAAHQASLSVTNSQSLLKFTQTHVHRVSDSIQPSHSLSSPSPPGFNCSQHHGFFKWISSLHQVAKDWSFSFSTSPSNEHSALLSFRMGWLDLLAVQGTLNSLLQHHSSKASILWRSVQLSHHTWPQEKP